MRLSDVNRLGAEAGVQVELRSDRRIAETARVKVLENREAMHRRGCGRRERGKGHVG